MKYKDSPPDTASAVMARRDGQIGVMMDKKKTLYMIGNAHLDIVWLWQWQEGCQEVKATFRSALDRMKEYDDFFFYQQFGSPL